MGKVLLLYIALVAACIETAAQPAKVDIAFASTITASDSSFPSLRKELLSFRSSLLSFHPDLLLEHGTAAHFTLGFSMKDRPIEAFYFPGTSDKRALIIGGMHGSELSSIAVAEKITELLSSSQKPFYHTIIIPSLFPDNAVVARANVRQLTHNNIGRYTDDEKADPNRQMPLLGKAFDQQAPADLYGRTIEWENQLLLELIQQYRPARIVNLHAIRDTTKAGIFADPRTDCQGIALGFETDSLLAVSMARFIRESGGSNHGNFSGDSCRVLYHNDPHAVPAGEAQPRNLQGSRLPKHRGCGVSLGSWATTAVCDSLDQNKSRKAMRLITVEFPGYRAPADYKLPQEQENAARQAEIYSWAIVRVFLEKFQEE